MDAEPRQKQRLPFPSNNDGREKLSRFNPNSGRKRLTCGLSGRTSYPPCRVSDSRIGYWGYRNRLVIVIWFQLTLNFTWSMTNLQSSAIACGDCPKNGKSKWKYAWYIYAESRSRRGRRSLATKFWQKRWYRLSTTQLFCASRMNCHCIFSSFLFWMSMLQVYIVMFVPSSSSINAQRKKAIVCVCEASNQTMEISHPGSFCEVMKDVFELSEMPMFYIFIYICSFCRNGRFTFKVISNN